MYTLLNVVYLFFSLVSVHAKWLLLWIDLLPFYLFHPRRSGTALMASLPFAHSIRDTTARSTEFELFYKALTTHYVSMFSKTASHRLLQDAAERTGEIMNNSSDSEQHSTHYSAPVSMLYSTLNSLDATKEKFCFPCYSFFCNLFSE